MIDLPKRYRWNETLFDGPTSLLLGVTDEQRGEQVILKTTRSEHPSSEQVEQFQNDYEVTRELSIAGVRSALELNRYGHRPILLFPHHKAVRPLDQLKLPLPIAELLPLAVTLFSILAQLHQAKVVHRNIAPSHLLYAAPSGSANDSLILIDFGVATRLPAEATASSLHSALERNLAYVSPELLEPADQAIDHRADLYSAGATLYYLATGHPPFECDRDPHQLLRCLATETPCPAHQLNPALPQQLSALLERLLTKSPDQRYEEASAVTRDLSRLIESWQHGEELTEFVPGEHERLTQHQLPDKVFGRERESAELIAALARVREGRAELVLVSGESGIGKSALLKHFVGQVSDAYVAIARCERVRAARRLSGIVDAVESLLRQLLGKSRRQLERYQGLLKQLDGELLGLLAAALPSLESVAERPLPPPPRVSRREAERRFDSGLERLIQSLADPRQPVIFCVDDLHWADTATLKLLRRLLQLDSARGLLLIGAHRESGQDDDQPLSESLVALASSHAVTAIRLRALTRAAVAELLSDSVHGPLFKVDALADLVLHKTGGNPLFLRLFLTELLERDEISYDPVQARWHWNEAAIACRPSTDNMVELLATALERLEHRTRELLPQAALLGMRFDLTSLAALTGEAHDKLTAALSDAVAQELLVPLGASTFRFSHERIQQAAYAKLAKSEQVTLHRRRGVQLLHRLRSLEGSERDHEVIETLWHLDRANLDSGAERSLQEQVVRLNLHAGMQAREAGDHITADAYFRAGLTQLPAAPGKSEQIALLATTLYLESARLTLAHDQLERATELHQALLATQPSAVARWGTRELRVRLRASRGDPDTALEEGIMWLRGRRWWPFEARSRRYSLPFSISLLALALLYRPALARPIAVEIVRQHSESTLHDLIRKTWDLPTRKGGKAISTASSDRREGATAPRCGDAYDEEPRSRLLIRYITAHLGVSVEDRSDELFDAYTDAHQAGDPVGAALCARAYAFESFHRGGHLPTLERRLAEQLDQLDLNRHPCEPSRLYLQAVRRLRYWGRQEGRQDGEWSYLNLPNSPLLRGYWLLTRAVVALHTEEAIPLRLFTQTGAMRRDATSPTLLALLDIAEALLMLRDLDPNDRRWRRRTRGLVRRSTRWAIQYPSCFRAPVRLVSAEVERIDGAHSLASEGYTQAAHLANEQGDLATLALIHQRAARYHYGRGGVAKARHHQGEALYCYRRWGAIAVADRLENELARGFDPSTTNDPPAYPQPPFNPNQNRFSEWGDVDTAIKAVLDLSAEMDRQRLLSLLMKMVMESTGAERGHLLLEDERGELYLRASGDSAPSGVTLHSAPLADDPQERPAQLPWSIINFVHHAKQDVVLHEASRDGAFGRDPYLQRQERTVRSLLCVPITISSRLLGLLYLENNLAPGRFNSHRLELLRLICAQGAIALENANLYAEQAEQNRTLERTVTERTEALREAKERAERAHLVKSRFLSHMSHELRAPLNAILWYSRRLEQDPQLPKYQRRFEIINRNGQNLLELIDDVLEMSKIEAGLQTLNESAFELPKLLSDAVELYAPSAAAKGTLLLPEIDLAVPDWVYSDESKLRQVLHNLISNAIKFIDSDCGEVKLRVRVVETRAAERSSRDPVASTNSPIYTIDFEVEDNGIGIEPEMQAGIFEPFIQGEGGRQRPGGTGLGLSISKENVALLGGELKLTSEPKLGSLFSFRLDLPAAPAGRPKPLRTLTALAPDQPPPRVLIADDCADSRALLVDILRPLGCSVCEVSDGAEAVTAWREWQPELILMDIRMPHMDGLEASRLILAESQAQAEPVAQRGPVILAITTSAQDQAASLNSGCRALLRKPLDEQLLFQAMERYLGLRFN